MPIKDIFDKWLSFQNEGNTPATLINGIPVTSFNPQYSARLWPACILNTFIKHGTKIAKIKCQLENLNSKKSLLMENRANGECPKFLQFKFKKLYNDPSEVSTKAAMLDIAIKSEIDYTNNLMIEKNNILENQYTSLTTELLPIINSTDYQISTAQLKSLLDYSVQYIHSGFILKQQADKELKRKKRENFLNKKELENEEITVKRKDVVELNKMIKLLQMEVNQLKSKQGKEKGKFRKATGNPKQTKEQRSTKDMRKSNGKRRNIAKSNK